MTRSDTHHPPPASEGTETMTHHVALFDGPIIGTAETKAEAIALASPHGQPFNVDFYDAEDGPNVQGYEPDGMGVWIIDPAEEPEE